MARKRLLLGPWVGEFGPEVTLFAPRVRYLSASHEVWVAARPQNEALYSGCAARFIGLSLGSWDCAVHKCRDFPRFQPRKFWDALGVAGERRSPSFESLMKLARNRQVAPQRYGRPQERGEVLVHCRDIISRKHLKRRRNFDAGRMAELVPEATISIGDPRASLHVPGTHDLRGAPLVELFDVFRSARILVTPDSGATHLAHHCDCAAVHWGDRHPADRPSWRPFMATAPSIDLGTLPEMEKIHRGVRAAIRWVDHLPQAIADSGVENLTGLSLARALLSVDGESTSPEILTRALAETARTQKTK